MKALRTSVPDAVVLEVLDRLETLPAFQARHVWLHFEALGFLYPFSRAAADNLLRRLKRARLIAYQRNTWIPL